MMTQFNSAKRAIYNWEDKANNNRQQNPSKGTGVSAKIIAVLLIWAILLPIALPVPAVAIDMQLIGSGSTNADELLAPPMFLPSLENLSKDLSATTSALTKSPLAVINGLLGLNVPDMAGKGEKDKGDKVNASIPAEAEKPVSREALLKRVERIEIKLEAEKTVVIGETFKLDALPVDKEGSPIQGLAVEWKTSNSQIIKIKDGDYAVAAETGEAVLTVNAGDAKNSIVVKVVMPSASKSLAAKTTSSTQNVTTTAPLAVNQLPVAERESIYSYENNLGSPAGQVEMDSPNQAAATRIKHRAGIANFSFGVSLASLSGRGIDAGAAMTYNSRTWNKSCQNDSGGNCTQNHFTYDVEQSWIAPGFTTGFGYLESAVEPLYYSGSIYSYKTYPTGLIEPDGTRRELYCRQPSGSACLGYETSDGSFIRISGQVEDSNPANAKFNAVYPNGSKVYYAGAFGTDTFRKHYPLVLQDSNGNRVGVAYKSDQSGRIDYIRDTLNRDIKFYYGTDAAGNANKLVAITIPGMNANEELQTVRFYYQNLTLNAQTGFSGQVTAPSTPIQVLSFVYFPATKTGFKYDYHANYGMIKKIARLVGMTVSDAASTSATGTVTGEGTWAATTEYDFPDGSTALSDVPKYTKRTDDWQGRTSATASETFFDVPELAAGADRISRVSVKDKEYNSATNVYTDFETVNETVSYNTGDWMNGLIKETYVKKKFGVTGQFTTVMAKTKYFWEQGQANYGRRKNPILRKVEITNDAGQTRTIRYDYDQYNNQTAVKEYDFGKNEDNATPLRSTITSYETRAGWINRNLLNLPVSVETIAGGVTVSKTLLEYDHNGSDATLTRHDDMDDNTHSVSYNPSRNEDKWQRICPDGTANFSSTQLTTAPNDQCHWIHYPGYISAVSSYRGNVTKVGRMLDLTATTITNTNSNKTDYNYDIAGNLVSATLSCCQLKTLDYGATFAETGYAYPVKETKGTSPQLVTGASYNKNTGLITSSKDENDQITGYEYETDTLRQKKVTYPNGGYALIEYSDKLVPDPISYTRTTVLLDAGKTVQSYSYFDGRGSGIRSAAQTPEGWTVSAMEYDALGRPKKSYNPFTAATPAGAIPAGTKYTEVLNTDSLGRTTQVRFQDNTTAQTVFNGTVVTATDQAGKQRRQTADALGRIVRVDEPDLNGNLDAGGNPAQPTVYEYDGNDNLAKIIQTEGAVTQTREFKYDALSRLINEKQVEANATLNDDGVFVGVGAGIWTGYYKYNPSGLLEKGVDARGVTTTFGYDGLNRIQTVTYDGEGNLKTPAVTYNYGSNKYLFNNGRLTSVVTTPLAGDTPSTAQSYDYNLVGQIKKQTETIGTSSYVMEYDYYLAGGLKWQKYHSGREVAYSIDNAGRLSGISDGQRTYANNFQFENGLLKGMSLGNGTAESYKYNDRLQLESQSLTKGNTVQQKLVYGYGEINPATGLSANNGKVSKVENYVGGTTAAPAKQQEQRFVYDSIGRLKQSVEVRGDSGAQVYQQTYSYDNFGNRYQKAAENQNSGIGYQAVEDTDIDKASNRFTSPAMAYDNAGNITTDNRVRTQSYWYDANGRMIRAQGQLKSTVYQSDSVYDALGQRVAAQVNGIWQHFVYDISGQMVAEYGTESEGKGAVNYIHKDQQGSTRVTTNASGWVSSRSDYTAFGEEIIAGVGQGRTATAGYNAKSIREKYALTERDQLTGLDHTDWRKLSSSTGRWTSPDPYKGSMSLGDPQSFNRYSYVNNDPVNFIDPSGLNASSGSATCFTIIRDIYYNGVYLYSREEGGFCFGGNNNSSGGGTTMISGGGGGQQTKRAKFDDGKFKDCVNRLFETTVKGYAWNGKVGAFSGQSELAKTYSDYLFNSSKNGHIGIITSTELNTVQLGERAGQRLGLGGGSIIKAWTDENNPRSNFVAKDFANSGEYGMSLWVYEIGNALGYITGKNKDITVADKKRYDNPPDKDVGGALVDCVYDGAVTPQGGIRPPSSGR